MKLTTSTISEPPLIKGHFLFGYLMEAKNEGVYFYTRISREHGDAQRLKFAHQTVYLFFHPDHNKEVLVDKADQFIKGVQYDPLRLLLGNGLLTSVGKDWSKQRRMLQPLFGKEGMDILLNHLNRISEKYSNLTLDQEIDWSKHMLEYTLEVAFAFFFGSSFSDEFSLEDKNKLLKASSDCIRLVTKRMSNIINPPIILPIQSHREFRKSYSYLKNTVEKIYHSRLNNQDNGLSNDASKDMPRDMLDMLMRAEDVEGKLTREEVFDQILSFLMAGHETTALTMSWFFYLLASRPEIQEKISDEAKKNNYAFESSLALAQYPYLMAVINETMRLYPSGWIIARTASEDATVGGFLVKKGSTIAVSPLITHRDPRWWSNPEEFIPERFLEGHPLFNQAPKNAFLPFSIGKRNCIGSRVALLEIALFAIHFFKERRVITKQDSIKMKGSVTLKSDQHMMIKVVKA